MDLYLTSELFPFSFAFGIVLGLLALEIIFMFIGIDLRIGSEADADLPQFEVGGSVGMDTDLGASIDLPDGFELSDVAEFEPGAGPSAFGVILDNIGMTKVTMTVWFALLCASFAAVGIFGQGMMQSTLGFMLPSWIAVPLAIVPALGLTKLFAGTVGRLLPQITTTSISQSSFGRRIGVVTTGTALRGQKVEVRFTDQHNNLHYLRAEPLHDEDVIPQGSEVLIVRIRDVEAQTNHFRIIQTS